MRQTLAVALAASFSAAALAQAPSPPPSILVKSQVDSGFLTNSSDRPAVVFRHRFAHAGSDWLQLHFESEANLPVGSFIRMAALRDGAVQRLDGRSIVDWGHHSAMFNGDVLVLELVAAPKSTGNRVIVGGMTCGAGVGGSIESICGIDNRVPSTDPREGRLALGCTGWMISPDLMLTAGHCTSNTRIIEFNVPPSTPGGSLVHPHPDDQYPYVELSGLNAGVGSDWRVCRVGVNSNHGQLPTQRNGNQWFQLGAVPNSTSGSTITITGYGVGSGVQNQAQTTHTGPLAQIRTTSLCYVTDTTGGNSGSPVIDATTGRAVGIHTHGGCTSSGTGCNSGTRIDRSDLQAAIQAAGGVSGAGFANYGAGCPSPNVFYELFTSGSDLSGRSFRLTASASGWNVTACTANCFESSIGAGLGLSDDQLAGPLALGFSMPLPGTSPSSTTAIDVDSNGWIGLIAGRFSSSDYSESVAEFLADEARLAVFWDDLNPASAGAVHFNALPGKAVITWSGVPQYGSSTPQTFQAQLFANGDIVLSYQSLSAPDGIVGYSAGGGLVDPGSTDLTASVPFHVGGGVPLSVSSSALPVLGTTIQLRVENVPSGGGLVSLNLGFGQQAIDLGLIGMDGCKLLTTVEQSFSLPPTSPMSSLNFAVPNIPSLDGLSVYVQGIALSPGTNALGVIASNGGTLRLGT